MMPTYYPTLRIEIHFSLNLVGSLRNHGASSQQSIHSCRLQLLHFKKLEHTNGDFPIASGTRYVTLWENNTPEREKKRSHSITTCFVPFLDTFNLTRISSPIIFQQLSGLSFREVHNTLVVIFHRFKSPPKASDFEIHYHCGLAQHHPASRIATYAACSCHGKAWQTHMGLW